MTIGPEHPDHPGYQAPRPPDPSADEPAYPAQQPYQPYQPSAHSEPSQQAPQDPQAPSFQQPGPGYYPAAPPPYGYYRNESHSGATTSMVLGIIALAAVPVAAMCCVSLPAVLLAPFAWLTGARAKRAIDAEPGRYSNRGHAEAGVVMGIIGTVLAVLVIAAVVLFIGFFAASWPDPVGTNV